MPRSAYADDPLRPERPISLKIAHCRTSHDSVDTPSKTPQSPCTLCRLNYQESDDRAKMTYSRIDLLERDPSFSQRMQICNDS